MSKKQKRPIWFKLYLSCKSVFDAVPDEVVGKAIKAGLRYLETGEVEELDSLTSIVFAVLKPHIDEAVADVQRSVYAGMVGAKKRWGKGEEDSPPIAPLSTPIGVHREEEIERELEEEIEERDREKKGDTAATPPRTPYGKFQNVFLSSKEVAELEAAIPEWRDLVNRLSVYMESTGKEYKSHYATLISWHEQDNQRTKEQKSAIVPIPGVPTL